jgi:hypothetical protein
MLWVFVLPSWLVVGSEPPVKITKEAIFLSYMFVLAFPFCWWMWGVLVTAILPDLLFCQMLALALFSWSVFPPACAAEAYSMVWSAQAEASPKVPVYSSVRFCGPCLCCFDLRVSCFHFQHCWFLLARASCCQLSRVIISHGGSSLSHAIDASLPAESSSLLCCLQQVYSLFFFPRTFLSILFRYRSYPR